MGKTAIRKPFKKGIIRFSAAFALLIAVVVAAGFSMRCALNTVTKENYPMKYSDEVKAASEKYGVDEALIYAVIKTESNFNPDARSSAGAVGLMQLMPDTFTWMQTMYKDENDYTFEDLYDPALNIDYGTETLSVLLDMYEDEETAICAYNGGLGNVNSWLEDENYSDDGKTLKKVPFAETDNYRRTVERNKSIYNYLYFGGEKPSGVE